MFPFSDEDYNIDSFLDIRKNLIKEEIQDGGEEHASKRSKHRTQKYRKAWESCPEFESWLQPVEQDDLSAQCTVCSAIIKAEITVLRRHASSAKHMKNAEAVQAGTHNVEFRFRKEWQKHKDFRHWVGRVENNDSVAVCLVCMVRMNANQSELKQHSRSKSHLDNLMIKKPERVERILITEPNDYQSDDEHEAEIYNLEHIDRDFNQSFDINNIKLTQLRIEGLLSLHFICYLCMYLQSEQ